MAGSRVRRSARVPGPVLRLSAVGDPRARPERRGKPRRSTSSPTRSRARSSGSRSGRPSLRPLLTIAVALPGLVRPRALPLPWAERRRAVVLVPFVLPTVVVALAFLAILPGPVQQGWAPILVAHVFFNVAVVVRVVGTFWANLDPRVSEAAATLGASPWRRFREITLPLLSPGARGRRRHRLPLLVHVVRHRPHPRRPAVRDARGRDLRPGRSDLRPARGRGPVARPARLRAGRRRGRRATRTALASPGSAAARARRAAPPAAPRREARRRREPRRARALPRRSRWRCSSNARSPSATATASTPTGRSARRRASLLAAPWDAVVNSLVYAAAATAIAVVVGGARRVRGRRRRAARALLDGSSAPARRVGGDARARLPDRLRHAAGRLPRRAVDRAGRAGARGDPVRRSHRRADPALDRRAPTRGGSAPRSLAGRGCAARSTCRSVSRAARGRRRLRVRHLARGVRRDGVPRAARSSDAAGRDLPLPRTAGRAQRRARRTRSRSCSWPSRSSRCSSSSACARHATAGSSDAPGGGRQRSARGDARPRRRGARAWGPARWSRSSARADRGRRRCCG